MEKKNIEIMDVTLRDGSYAIDFQYSEYDTRMIGVAMENAGIKLIEIGHGMGLNASSANNGLAACTDAEYLAEAQKSYKKCKYGTFCIPGIAQIEDLNLLKEYGASFVRIGTNIDKIKTSQPYIEKAKKLGLTVMANYMKSYTATSEQFECCVKLSKSYGADFIYVVDSAGCMLPDDVKRYFDIIQNIGGVKAGFHGHNNLGLAVANSLYAIDLGFDLVDCSLQGLGRSAGNAATELLLALLKVKYHNNNYNVKGIIDFSEEYIKPLIRDVGLYGLDIYSGIAGFHSSYMKYIRKYAAKYSVNPYDLIVEYCKHDQVNMNEGVLCELAQKLPRENYNISKYGFNRYVGDEQNI